MKAFVPFLFILSVILSSCNLLGNDDTRPEIPGKIVFAANDKDGNSQIFTMNANGSKVQQLTDFDPSGEAMQPSWSPDGTQIIFSSFKQSTSIGPALWVMNADGSNQRVLFDAEPNNPHAPPLAGSNARWSPDGLKVVFDLCLNCQIATNYDIYIFNTATKELTQLTNHPASETNPTWSPDGSHIAFESDRDYVDADTLRFRKDLYRINADGSDLHRLTKTGYARKPVWSPNINMLVYESNIKRNEIYLYKINSNETQNLETGFKFAGNPQWNNQAKELLVFGRESEQSQPSMKYINLDKPSPEILHEVTLNKNAIGRNYDWFIPD